LEALAVQRKYYSSWLVAFQNIHRQELTVLMVEGADGRALEAVELLAEGIPKTLGMIDGRSLHQHLIGVKNCSIDLAVEVGVCHMHKMDEEAEAAGQKGGHRRYCRDRMRVGVFHDNKEDVVDVAA
jgi:hypothetical protein